MATLPADHAHMRRASAEASADVAGQARRLCASIDRLQQGSRAESPRKTRHAVGSDTYRTIFPSLQPDGQGADPQGMIRRCTSLVCPASSHEDLAPVPGHVCRQSCPSHSLPASHVCAMHGSNAASSCSWYPCWHLCPPVQALRACAASPHTPSRRAHTLEEAMQEAKLAGILADSSSEAGQEVSTSPCPEDDLRPAM